MNEQLQVKCRICGIGPGMPDFPIICPCHCPEPMRYVHQSCLQKWIKNSGTLYCKLCHFHFITRTETKPFTEWQKPDLSLEEQRDMCCYITCFVLNVICIMIMFPLMVVSLFWLTTYNNEISGDMLKWRWISLVVNIFFFSYDAMLLYVGWKYGVYGKLFERWREFNTIIYVENVPEKESTDEQLMDVIWTTSQMIAAHLISEEIMRILPDEDEFHSFQSSSNSPSNNYRASSSSVNFDDENNTPGNMATADTCSAISIQISFRDNERTQVDDINYSLCEIMVVSSTTDDVSSSEEEDYPPFFSKQS